MSPDSTTPTSVIPEKREDEKVEIFPAPKQKRDWFLFFKKIPKKWKIAIYVFAAFFVLFTCFLVYANFKILGYKKYIVSPFDLPTTTYGIVFGGGVEDNKTLGPMPMDRILQAIALFKTGKIERLMITGDDGGLRGDEVGVMGRLVADYGVPEDNILVDPHGYRTYESCYRESQTYGVKQAVVVSQSFHLPRIIYICRHFGIETVGVASDLKSYGFANIYMNLRETGARLKAWWQVSFTKPLPRDLTKK